MRRSGTAAAQTRGGGSSAAAAAGRAPRRRRARAQVLARRQVPAADRQARQDGRQRQHRRRSIVRPRWPSMPPPTRCTSPTARQPPRRRLRRRDRRLQAPLGRVRREAGRCRHRAPTIRTPRRRSSSATSSCVEDREGRHGLRLRPQERPHPGVPEGRQVREGSVRLEGRRSGEGSVWDIAFSSDPQQRFLYVADGHDQKVFILDRDTLDVVSSFGDGGRWPGQFYGVGSVAVDSKGNVYTGETYDGKRVQKFVVKGLGVDDDQQTKLVHRPEPARRWQALRHRRSRCLALAERALERAPRRSGTVQAPRFEVDPIWPKPLPNHWVLGQTIGARLDAQDHVWIVHRADSRRTRSRRPPIRTADRRVLPQGAAGARVRSGGQPASATGAGPATGYEWPASNHGITIDNKGNVWIGGNGAQRRAHPEVHAGRQVPDAVRRARARAPTATTPSTSAASRRSSSTEGERGLHRRRLRQQARRGDRRRHRQVQALLGRLRQQAGRRRTSGRYNPNAPPAQQFRNPVHCAELSNDGLRLRLRPRRTIASRCSRKDGKFVKEAVHREATRSATARCGTSRSRRIRSRSTSTSPTARTRRSTSSIAQSLRDPDQLRRRRPPARPVLRRAQHRDRLEGQHLHDRDLRGTPPAEVRVQGHRSRSRRTRASSGQSSVRLQPHHRR